MSAVLLVSGLLLMGFAVFQAIVAVALYWSIRQFLPLHQVSAQLAMMESNFHSLNAQVNKLRTSKAGSISNAKRRQAEEQQAQEEDEDPLLAGLAPEDRALFKGFE